MRRYHLHIPGAVYGFVTITVGLAAVNSQNNLLFWVFGLMFSALIVSGVFSGAMMMSIRVRRLDPHHGAVGEPLLVRYELTNRSRLLPAFNVHVEELAAPGLWSQLMKPAGAWVMHAGPRETVHGEAVFWPTRRGRAGFDRIRLWTTFPFGIVKKSITISQPHHTLIYPRLHELRRDVLRAASPPGASGVRPTAQPGAGDDYFGLREYRAGDSARRIAWKRSAALDQLVCIERSLPSPQRLRVILNLTTPTDQLRAGPNLPPSRELEELAIELAASVVYSAYHEGYDVGLTVLGADVPVIALRRSCWHLRKIMAALAAIDIDAPRIAPLGGSVADSERAGLVVVHPDRVDLSAGGPHALHLTSNQLAKLAVKPMDWDPGRFMPAPTPVRTMAGVAAAASGRAERAGAAA
jgi:uncharacterized protein (DUF58 family)